MALQDAEVRHDPELVLEADRLGHHRERPLLRDEELVLDEAAGEVDVPPVRQGVEEEVEAGQRLAVAVRP